MLQTDLYNKVNAQYLTQSVLGFKENSFEQWADNKAAALATKASKLLQISLLSLRRMMPVENCTRW
jgi:hypothetical protein